MSDFVPPENRPGRNPLYGDQVWQQRVPNGGVQMSLPYKDKATAGLVLGIIAITIWLIPLVGAFASIVCSILGIVMSSEARKSPIHSSRADAGLVLSIIAVALVPTLLLCTMGGILLI